MKNSKRVTQFLIIDLLIVSLLFIGLSLPLVLEKVPPNPYYGYRVAKTMSDPEIWYKVNKFSGTLLLVGSVFSVMLAGILWWRRQSLSLGKVIIAVLLGIVMPAAIMVIVPLIYLRHL